MANKITNTEHYAAIANAIRRKNGETDTYTPAEMADAIGRIPKGGGASEGDVTFFDYDGTVVETYTAEEFAELTEMPENPDHTGEGLTSQGWNWSFANAKAYVAKYGKLNVGQMYVPTDGKTHVFINIDADEPSYETTLYFGHATESERTVIDWGDGTPTETASGSSAAGHSHIYAMPGKYEVTLDTTVGTMTLVGSGTSNSRTNIHFSGSGSYARNLTRILKVQLGRGVTSIGDYVFAYNYALRSVTIPDSVTSIGKYAFSLCYKIQSITIPDSVTSIGTYALSSFTFLQSIAIPDSVTSIGDYAFYSSYALRSVTIPDSVTSIGTYAFSYNYALRSVTIPDSVTIIGGYAFNNSYGILTYHLKPTTPPTLSYANAFNNISTDTVFYVPAESLEAYKTATNWSTYADRIVAEPE